MELTLQDTLFSASLAVYMTASVFVAAVRWGYRCQPYARHMDSSLHGRVHEASVIFDRVDGEGISLVDGVRFYSLIFLADPDKHGDRERMFYWDAELPLPSFAPGQEVSVTYYDRFITSCQLIH